MDKQDLKNCPFCGGFSKVVRDYQGIQGICQGCLTATRLYNVGLHGSGEGTVKQIWNTRPEEDKLNARIKELEEVVSEFSRLVKNKSIIHNKEKHEDINRIADLLIPLLNKGN